MFKKILICCLGLILLFFSNLVFSNDIQPNIDIEDLYNGLMSENEMIQNDAIKGVISYGEEILPLFLEREELYWKINTDDALKRNQHTERFYSVFREILVNFIISDIEKKDYQFILNFLNEKRLEKLGFKQTEKYLFISQIMPVCEILKKKLNNQYCQAFLETIFKAHKEVDSCHTTNYKYLLETAIGLCGDSAFSYLENIYEENGMLRRIILSLIITKMKGVDVENFILGLMKKNEPLFYFDSYKDIHGEKFKKNLRRFNDSFKVTLKELIVQQEKDKYIPLEVSKANIYYPYIELLKIYYYLDKETARLYLKKISQDKNFSLEERVMIGYFLFDNGDEQEALPILLWYLKKEYFFLDGVFIRLSKISDVRMIPYLIDYINRGAPLSYKAGLVLCWLNPVYWMLKHGLDAIGGDVPSENKGAAAEILRKITGQSYTYKQGREWRKWWEKNKAKYGYK